MIILYTPMLWRIKITLFTFLSIILSVTNAFSFPGMVRSHNIRIEFDLKNHSIDAVDRLMTSVTGKNEVTFSIHNNVSIGGIREVNGKELDYFIRSVKDQKDVTVRIPVNKSVIELEIHYRCRFPDLPRDVKFSREFLSDKPVVYAGDEIILLDGSACWYPCVDGFSTFNVTAVTPSGYEVVMEGTRVSRVEKNGVMLTTWDFPHPVGGIYLIGDRKSVV